MKTFKLNYEEMIGWYKDNKDNPLYFNSNANIISFFVEENPDIELKKYKNEKLDRYVVRSQTLKNTIRKMNYKVHNQTFFPFGLYSMIDKDKLYCVFPKWKTNDANDSFVFADHFSFMYKKNIKKQIQFHLTVYQPDIFDIHVGRTAHTHCHFPDDTTFPLISYDTRVLDNNMFEIYNIQKDTLDMMRWYKSQNKSQDGGMKRTRTSALSKKTTTNNVSQKLQRMLREENISSIKAFGVKFNKEWYFSCFVNYSKEAKDDKNNDNYAFIAKYSTYKSFERYLCKTIHSNNKTESHE